MNTWGACTSPVWGRTQRLLPGKDQQYGDVCGDWGQEDDREEGHKNTNKNNIISVLNILITFTKFFIKIFPKTAVVGVTVVWVVGGEPP